VRFGTGTKEFGILLATAATAFALIAPGAASAGLLTTGAASDCNPEVSQVFAPWGDSANYRLVPGGSFESGSPSWALSGGAKLVSGNERFNVIPGTRSLYLPSGSTATSPTMCFTIGDWHARFFTRNTGNTNANLEVDILVPSLLGVVSVLDGGYVKADGTWDPSPRVSAALSNVGGLLGLTRAVSFRLKARGTGAEFQVDDVFLDPFRCR
jgi:hypothetical protein